MSTELATRPNAELSEKTPTIGHLLDRVRLIQEVMAKVMHDGTHYGASYPGDEKKNLLKAGADSLCVAFQFVPEFTVYEKDLGSDQREYRVDASIKTPHGILVATGVGVCSTMESKYRYRKQSRKCPACGAEAIFQSKYEEAGDKGFYCWKKKGGCDAKFKSNDKRITGQEVGRVVNEDPADQWNTVLKIAKKRAFVDAVITATGASDMFTQDAEDFGHGSSEEPKAEAKAESKPGLSLENEALDYISAFQTVDTEAGFNALHQAFAKRHGEKAFNDADHTQILNERLKAKKRLGI